MDIQELEGILTKLQKEEVFVNREIKQCPDGKLMQSRSGEATVYFQVMMEDGKRVRRSITQKPGMIQGLARKKWADMPYEQSAYMPERKIHMTSRGLLVRSKSEVMIAEKFYEYNVPFRYEQVLTIGKYMVAPDFTVMRQDGELRYWEHCGLTNNKKYMEHHKWKLNLYESVGIVPWKNLIVTYDEEDGTINMQIIESEIRNKLL